MDIDGLITELQIRGFDEAKIDSALKCLVHVHAVQDFTNEESGGVLVRDILSSYPFEVTSAASELYFERMTVYGQDVFRVKWGNDAAAQQLERNCGRTVRTDGRSSSTAWMRGTWASSFQ